LNQKQVIGTLSGWYGAGVWSRQTDWLLPLENLLEGLGERWRVSGTAGNAAGADKTDPKTFATADDPEEPEMIMRDSIRKMPYLQRDLGLSALEMWVVKRLLQLVATALAGSAALPAGSHAQMVFLVVATVVFSAVVSFCVIPAPVHVPVNALNRDRDIDSWEDNDCWHLRHPSSPRTTRTAWQSSAHPHHPPPSSWSLRNAAPRHKEWMLGVDADVSMRV
jgi:hypothetical protein